MITVFIYPAFLNLNNYKSNFEMELSAALKTNVKIEGDIKYTLKTGPKLQFKNIFFESGEGNTINGKVEIFNATINPFNMFKKNFSFKNFSVANGSISISKKFFKLFIKNNKKKFKKINFKNIDLKIINNKSEIEFNNNNGKFFFNKKTISGANIEGLFSGLSYEFRLKNQKLEFKIPSIKLFLEFSINGSKNKRDLLQIKFANKIFFPGFKNIYFRSDVISNNNSIELNNVKITSSVYSGLGSLKIYHNPKPFVSIDLSFGRTNFASISDSKWVSFFKKDLFEVAKLINGNIKIKFKHIILENKYFDDLHIDVSFDNGDIITNNIDFISDKHTLNLSGRFIQNKNDSLFFFNSKFSTNRLKKLCIKVCKSTVLTDNYSMESKGTFNIKKSKFFVDYFSSQKKLSKLELNMLNKDLNSVFSGNLEKVFFLNNFLKLY